MISALSFSLFFLTLDQHSWLNPFVPGFGVVRPHHLINVSSYYGLQSKKSLASLISINFLVVHRKPRPFGAEETLVFYNGTWDIVASHQQICCVWVFSDKKLTSKRRKQRTHMNKALARNQLCLFSQCTMESTPDDRSTSCLFQRIESRRSHRLSSPQSIILCCG